MSDRVGSTRNFVEKESGTRGIQKSKSRGPKITNKSKIACYACYACMYAWHAWHAILNLFVIFRPRDLDFWIPLVPLSVSTKFRADPTRSDLFYEGFSVHAMYARMHAFYACMHATKACMHTPAAPAAADWGALPPRPPARGAPPPWTPWKQLQQLRQHMMHACMHNFPRVY